MTDLNKAVKQIRLHHKLNQGDMAWELNITGGFLSQIESEDEFVRKNITMDLLRRYAEYFQVKMSDILIFAENLDSPSRFVIFSNPTATHKIASFLGQK